MRKISLLFLFVNALIIHGTDIEQLAERPELGSYKMPAYVRIVDDIKELKKKSDQAVKASYWQIPQYIIFKIKSLEFFYHKIKQDIDNAYANNEISQMQMNILKVNLTEVKKNIEKLKNSITKT